MPSIGLRDYYPVLCTWLMRRPRCAPKGRTTIQYRTFKRFNKDAFLLTEAVLLSKLLTSLIILMMLCPRGVILLGLSLTIMLHYEKREREKKKEKPKLPPWLTKDVTESYS